MLPTWALRNFIPIFFRLNSEWKTKSGRRRSEKKTCNKINESDVVFQFLFRFHFQDRNSNLSLLFECKQNNSSRFDGISTFLSFPLFLLSLFVASNNWKLFSLVDTFCFLWCFHTGINVDDDFFLSLINVFSFFFIDIRVVDLWRKSHSSAFNLWTTELRVQR